MAEQSEGRYMEYVDKNVRVMESTTYEGRGETSGSVFGERTEEQTVLLQRIGRDTAANAASDRVNRPCIVYCVLYITKLFS